MIPQSMRALAIRPGLAASAGLLNVPVPMRPARCLLVRAVAVGICGTDRELVEGLYGSAPSGQSHLVIGHESLGIVDDADATSPYERGQSVVGIVRRPDPVPCRACAIDEWDMCENGRYTERGIKEHDGFCSEWFTLDEAYAVKVDVELGIAAVLLEPASVVAKAWEQIDYFAQRSRGLRPRRVLVTGAGTVGLLAALMSQQRGFETHLFDRITSGPKPQLAADAGMIYHGGASADLGELAADVIIECTGAAPVIVDVMRHNARNAIVCLAGLSASGHELAVDVAALNQSMVLQNDIVFGTVNANRRHYQQALEALRSADPVWLARLISRRVALDSWQQALTPQADDIKVVIDFSGERRGAD